MCFIPRWAVNPSKWEIPSVQLEAHDERHHVHRPTKSKLSPPLHTNPSTQQQLTDTTDHTNKSDSFQLLMSSVTPVLTLGEFLLLKLVLLEMGRVEMGVPGVLEVCTARRFAQ
jgi:hypothetical protein